MEERILIVEMQQILDYQRTRTAAVRMQCQKSERPAA